MPTTHTDLAKSLGLVLERMKKVPPTFLVSDPTTLALIASTQQALIDQDTHMGLMTKALRLVRENDVAVAHLAENEWQAIRDALSWKPEVKVRKWSK